MATVYEALRLLSAYGWRVYVQKDNYRVLRHPTKPGDLGIHGKLSEQLTGAALAEILRRGGVEE